MFNIPDIDIDLSADAIKKLKAAIKHIPASKITEKGLVEHPCGIYPMNIPIDPLTGMSAIDYEKAEKEQGFIKIDLLHNQIYDTFKSESEIDALLKQPIDWRKLRNEAVVKTLPHINGYYSLLSTIPNITGIEELAMFLALIRPAKKHLQETVRKNGWDSIKDCIWVKEADEGYQFKKAHAIAYALAITLLIRKDRDDEQN